MKITIQNLWLQQRPTVKNCQSQTYRFKTLKTKRIIITKILSREFHPRIIKLKHWWISDNFKNLIHQIINKIKNSVLCKSAISKFSTFVDKDLLVLYTSSGISELILSSLWKKYKRKNWSLKLTSNVLSKKWKFISNLIIQTSSNSTRLSPLKKQFISLWNFVAQEIFMKKLRNKAHFHKIMLNPSSDK